MPVYMDNYVIWLPAGEQQVALLDWKDLRSFPCSGKVHDAGYVLLHKIHQHRHFLSTNFVQEAVTSGVWCSFIKLHWQFADNVRCRRFSKNCEIPVSSLVARFYLRPISSVLLCRIGVLIGWRGCHLSTKSTASVCFFFFAKDRQRGRQDSSRPPEFAFMRH